MFKNVSARRLILMILGNIILGLGIAIFKLSGLGNDPFSGMNMALANHVPFSYATWQVILNIVMLIVEIAFGRHYIGAGTIVNAVFLGYIVTFFYNLFPMFVSAPSVLWQRVLTVCIGVLIVSLGLSMYQTPDVGVAPYDSLSLIMAERFKKLPYFWCRIITDAICALVCFLAGGIIGLGTLVSAFGFGPFIHFFNVHFTEKLVEKK